MRGRRADCIRAFRRSAAATMLSTATACAPAAVEPLQSYQGPLLPRPEIVLVADFAAGPEAVTLDRGLGARLRNAVGASDDLTREAEDDRKVVAAISNTLVGEIRKLGLPVMRSNEASPPTDVDAVAVGGRILSIDEGNRTRRNVIGLGAGRSALEARAEIYYVTSGGGTQLVESFAADAESSRKPGAAETMGLGAATGRAAESALMTGATGVAPSLSGDVEADGERMAKAITKQLGRFFASQGWIPAEAAR
jgi:hypothetical protein